MSTKIWTAYRVTRGRDLWPLVHGIRTRAEAEAKKVLVKVYKELLSSWIADPKAHEAAQGMYEESWRIRALPRKKAPKLGKGPVDVSDFVRTMYIAQLGRMERDVFDLTVSIAARKSRRGWLLIPYPGSGLFRGVLDFLTKMPELEDYHYQNQTDQPEHISRRAWLERRDTWGPLLDSWQDMLVVNIIEGFYGFSSIDPVWDRKGRHVAMFRRMHRAAYPEGKGKA